MVVLKKIKGWTVNIRTNFDTFQWEAFMINFSRYALGGSKPIPSPRKSMCAEFNTMFNGTAVNMHEKC